SSSADENVNPTEGSPSEPLLLEGLLARQLTRLRLHFLAYGLGWLVAATGFALAAYFLLDFWLHVPHAARIVVSSGLAIAFVLALQRRVLYPQRRALSRDDAAILIERRFPELHERLISAVQLRDQVRSGRLREQSAAMIEKLVADATAAVQALPVAET